METEAKKAQQPKVKMPENRAIEMWLARSLMALERVGPVTDKEASMAKWREMKPEYLRRARRLIALMDRAKLGFSGSLQAGSVDGTDA